jgi:ribosomal protein S27AE
MSDVPEEFSPDEEKIIGCICVACGRQSAYENHRDDEWYCPNCHITEDPNVEGGHEAYPCPECGTETTYRNDCSPEHVSEIQGKVLDYRGCYICPGLCQTAFLPEGVAQFR